MRKFYLLLSTAVVAALLFGCTQAPSPEAGQITTDTTEYHEGHEGHDHDVATSDGDKVVVSAEGTKFDPAVPVEQMPSGAWACVMNDTVHYASMEKGDGECPVCGMDLRQPGSKSKE